jgi:hypothetical protein
LRQNGERSAEESENERQGDEFSELVHEKSPKTVGLSFAARTVRRKAVVSAENRVVIQNQTRFDGRFVAKPPI